MRFPHFRLEGSHEELGTTAGRLFGDRIRANYACYEQLFAEWLKVDSANAKRLAWLRDSIEKHAQEFARVVRVFFPDYAAEIESMAQAAKLPVWQVWALNARTEIFQILAKHTASEMPGECTALYFPHSRLLGQNWDWHPKLESLAVILEVRRKTAPAIMMFTEPGIIGKIGLNSAGLGVCLNILFADCGTGGVPVHILLRAVLDCNTVCDAVSIIEKVPKATASNFLIADASGNGIDLEFHGSELRQVSLNGGDLIHTNHYLGDEESASAAIPGSVERLNRASALYKEFKESGVPGMKEVLRDHENRDFPICRKYAQGLHFVVGTVASIILDLQAEKLHVARGQGAFNDAWMEFSL